MNENGWRTCFHAKRTGCSNATFRGAHDQPERSPERWQAQRIQLDAPGSAIASESRDSRDSRDFVVFWWIHKTQNCGVVESLPVWNGFNHFGGTTLNIFLAHQIIESLGCCRGVSLAMALPGFQYRPICPPIPRKYDSHIVNLWLYGMGWCMCVYI